MGRLISVRSAYALILATAFVGYGPPTFAVVTAPPAAHVTTATNSPQAGRSQATGTAPEYATEVIQAPPTAVQSPLSACGSVYPGMVSGYCMTPPPQLPAAPTNNLGSGLMLASMACSAGSGLSPVYPNAGFQSNSNWNPVTAQKVGTYMAAEASMPGSCSSLFGNFINGKGEEGQLGRDVEATIDEHKETFLGPNPPADLTSYCPNYNNFKDDEKKMFWINVFAAIASSESSCKTGAGNGGLYQLTGAECAKAGAPTDIMNGDDATKCAVTAVAQEIDSRHKLMSMCTNVCSSSGFSQSEVTYWGTLRVDDFHSARGGDISGSQKTRCLIRKFPDCGNPESLTSNPSACDAPSQISQEHCSSNTSCS